MKSTNLPPPPYILVWIKLLGDWPSIVNGGCRFALQARVQFIDQVRILPKTRMLWNHGRVLLCLSPGEILYATFVVNLKPSLGISWTDPCSTSRGLERHRAVQLGILEFSPRTVKTIAIATSCSTLGHSGAGIVKAGENRAVLSENDNSLSRIEPGPGLGHLGHRVLNSLRNV